MPRLGLDPWDYLAEWDVTNVTPVLQVRVDIGSSAVSIFYTDTYYRQAAQHDDENMNVLEVDFPRTNTDFEQANGSVTLSGNTMEWWNAILDYRQESGFPQEYSDVGVVSMFLTNIGEDEADDGWYLPVGMGYIDTVDLVSGGDTGNLIVINFVASQFAFYDQPKSWRYDHETQQRYFEGDLGFEFVERLADWDLWWGKAVKGGKKKRGKNKKRRKSD